jgi:hypothetical protein
MGQKLIDITGNCYGSLEVLTRVNNNLEGTYFKCKCKCGNVEVIRSDVLRKRNRTKCAECLKYSFKPGYKFNHITVLKKLGSIKKNNNKRNKACYWECRCDCDNIIQTTTNTIQNNLIQSCGCHNHEIYVKKSKPTGEIKKEFWNRLTSRAKQLNMDIQIDITPEYVWNLFLQQDRKCALSGVDLYFNQKCRDKIQTASLDRIDNTRGYVKGNVQWVHKDINRMKNVFTQEYFIETCKRIAEKHI